MRFLPLVLFSGLVACVADTPSGGSNVGTEADLEMQIAKFLAADPDSSFLIIQVSGSEEDFLQFTASSDSVQVDFPLITERQRQRERLIHDACSSLRLEPRINEGSDGARFLDCSIPSDVTAVSAVTRKLLRAVFRTSEETQLEFEHAP